MKILSTWVRAAISVCAIASAAAGAGANTAGHEFTAEFVLIRPDTSVALKISGCTIPTIEYEISKFELTNTEYAAFLNAVARKGDPYHLYSPMQQQHFWGGIVRSTINSNSVFEAKRGYQNLPATFVSWFDAIRYVNWLHFGRPDTGKSEIGTTEGTLEVGAYNTLDLEKAKPPMRNKGAKYFMPTCGEWLYSGFYDPTTKSLRTYVGGTSAPVSGAPGQSTNTANYYSGGWANPFPHLSEVSAYSKNISALGTLNQAGNVMEWVETNGNMALGGSLFLPVDTLSIDYRDSEDPSKKLSSFGFRVARSKAPSEERPLSFAINLADAAQQKIGRPAEKRTALEPDWTRIDLPGNNSDLTTGRGCVAHEYEISKTEITNAQYSAFLNATASQEDRFELYLHSMSSGVVGGLIRTRLPNGYSYKPKSNYQDRPATYLSWFTLARYANWQHYGMPIGKQMLGTTEGNSTQGAYDTRQFERYSQSPRMENIGSQTFTRNKGALYFIPNDDEWYKAAYYDPNKSGWQKYWKYPNKSDSPPDNDAKSHAGSNFQNDLLAEGEPYYVSEVGQFRSTGHYQIYDLGGNVWEWLETWRNLGGEKCWRCELPTKGLRGGSFNYTNVGLINTNIDLGTPSDHYFVYGGRLARTIEDSAVGNCLGQNTRYSAARYFGIAKSNIYLVISGAIVLALSVIAFIFIFRKSS